MNTLQGTLRRSAIIIPTMEQKLARCATPMTKFQLFNALTARNRKIGADWFGSEIEINGIKCTLSSIAREDGSGSSFNLVVYGPDGQKYKCYCRTSD